MLAKCLRSIMIMMTWRQSFQTNCSFEYIERNANRFHFKGKTIYGISAKFINQKWTFIEFEFHKETYFNLVTKPPSDSNIFEMWLAIVTSYLFVNEFVH